ncbi:MAG TPA: hypothetical protein VFL16_07570 [Steroidobacteraceae bacterium]|nr:hypothetical protein [Steroidobacteraceae bacterium]
MNEDIENRLRNALRRIDPPDGFTEKLLAALPGREVPARVTSLRVARPALPAGRWQRLAAPGALAASLLAAVFVGQQIGERRYANEQRAGLEASRELMQALRVTSRKLDVAYQAVHDHDAPPANVDAEESRT